MIGSGGHVVNQSYLARAVKTIFPDHDIKINARKTGNISNPSTGKFLELDIWIPSLSISFEFQDPYHYTSTWESHEPLKDIQLKDAVKSASVKQKGETLIIVPCWWDGSNSSLQATVSFYCPDLAWKEKKKASPIPLTPKIGYLNRFIPHIGALMLASFPVTLKLDETLSSETPWWLGEKYDGVRFCWNTRDRKIYTRSGMELKVPSFLYSHFPRVFLDGEFWLGRGNFQDAQRIVLSIASLSLWSFLRTVAFDNPDPRLRNFPFESRYNALLQSSASTHPFLIIAPRKLIHDHVKLERSITCIMEDGGEGVILRRPKSVYEHGRSPSLLKLKASREDREALVVLDKSDCVVLQTPEGATFSVPKEECLKQISAVPKKGEIVTFTYENLSRRDAPTNPKLLRIRKDVSWESVVHSSPQSQLLSEMSTKYGGFSARPTQYWSVGRQKNARMFFEKVAKSKNLDPRHVSTWYAIRRQDITKIQGAVPILAAFNGSIVNAILHTFPDIGLEKAKFRQVPKSHWQSISNRRKYLEQYAKSKGFDPLVTTNWYSVQVADFLIHKGGKVLYQSQESKTSSFATTLKEAFPELKFDDTKFPKTPSYFLKEKANRRQVLENFASRSGFDPLIPKNWYSIHSNVLCADKAVLAVMRMYDKSLVRMLLDIFPSILWDPSLFLSIPNNYWFESSNRRKFFEKFAKQKRFDPLIASNWSDFRPRHIIAKGGATVLQYYGGDVQAAVRHLFPDLSPKTTV
eukprot:Phypoly_transcript_02913.p1 GENE.Phypoly_transcript_02913~~Phypoly_transcript_02913.p1  ORF type:complete len:747 (+),score=87.92 Phypoly_transcript_02913:75-2315(+)